MSERKVLNKYYPPDFDPSKIPRMKIPRNRTFSVRLMAPCNMRCTTCGEYIYKGKKFNARKEDVDEEDYLGIRIYRFYIKCTRCLAEISFKTDPLNTDYVIEAGATRNFQALKLAEEAAEREEREKKEEEASNPMKLLENRTQASKREMEALEALQELRELNQRQAKVDYEKMLGKLEDTSRDVLRRQEEEDEEFVKKVFGKGATTSNSIKRLKDESSDSEVEEEVPVKRMKETPENATDLLLSNGEQTEKKTIPEAPKAAWQRSVGGISTDRKKLAGLVKVKKTEDKPPTAEEPPKAAAPAIGALGMIGGYSSSDADSDT